MRFLKNKSGPKPRIVDDIDRHVSRRLRELRMAHGISASELAFAVGMSVKLILSLERAEHRIMASRLYELARYFGVSVAAFYEDFAFDHQTRRRPTILDGEKRQFARLVARIADPDKRRKLKALLDALTA